MKDFFKKYKKVLVTVAVVGLMLAAYFSPGLFSSGPEFTPARNSMAVLVEKEQRQYLEHERPFSELLSALAADKVALMAVTTDGELLVRMRNNDRFYVHAPAPAGLLTDTLTKAKDRNVTVVTLRTASVPRPANLWGDAVGVMRDLLPVALLVMLLIMARGSLGILGGAKPYSIVKDPGDRFDDVIGAEDAKQALSDVVRYLKDPERFAEIGARAPKGVLLEGPPGTGKTLLARAVAGECGVTFISLNGASFSASFVGVGIGRVKALFREAAKHAPCVVFIDELDGVGNRDGNGSGGAAETENSRIINTLLTELDGFDTRSGIVVIGATNYASRLDAALTREGRFDRHCALGMPNISERAELFALYAKKVKMADGIDWQRLARRSAGLAPSAIAAVVNFAAIIAAQEDRDAVTDADLSTALERQQMGSPTASLQRAMSESLRRRVAIHEAGHALVGWKTGMGTLDGVTIVPRSRALGVTLLTQEGEDMLFTGSELRARISTFLAGRAAELLVLGEASTGASNDLERASAIALSMVSETALAGDFGPFSFKALGREAETLTRGEALPQAVALLREIEGETDAMLAENRGALEALANALLERETLTGEEALAVLQAPLLPA